MERHCQFYEPYEDEDALREEYDLYWQGRIEEEEEEARDSIPYEWHVWFDSYEECELEQGVCCVHLHE